MELHKVSDGDLRTEYVRRFYQVPGTKITGSKDVIDHLRTHFGENNRERFVVVFLNGQNAILLTETLFLGTLTSSVVYPREIVRRALELHSAAIIVAHNHPSGNPNASNDDKKITGKIKEACEVIDITLHDHVIIAGYSYYSFADGGIL
ncbi:MAG: DNA repair protein RadC [Candidatus Scalindua sp.]|nr:DNA repair protein RadC [Candidatus Scalindua sp.]